MKDAKKGILVKALRKLGDMVSAIAGGDRVILVSSGFPLVKETESAPPLTKPNPPVMKAGNNAREILLEGEVLKAARAIKHMIAPDPLTTDTKWATIVTTSTRYTFTNLISGQKYWGKQGYVGTKEQYVESDAVSYISQ